MPIKSIGSVTDALNVYSTLLNEPAGKIRLSQKYPNDFEYYMCAFELLKSDLSTDKYFIFPVMPNSINYNDTPLTKIIKTAGGVSVLKTQQFIPKNLTLNGNFGRDFKVIVGQSYQDIISNFRSDNSETNLKKISNTLSETFSDNFKTGYGCCKILEDILISSNQKDDKNLPRYLIFYNLALNQSFFVEYEDLGFSQSLESNMIWNYSIKLKAIGDSKLLLNNKKEDQKSNKQLIYDDFIQKTINSTYSSINTILKKSRNKIL